MKIVMTVADGADAYHIGLEVERRSGIVEIPDDTLPNCVKEYLRRKEWAKKNPNNNYTYDTLSFSILEE